MSGMDCAVCSQDINGKVHTTTSGSSLCTRDTYLASAAHELPDVEHIQHARPALTQDVCCRKSSSLEGEPLHARPCALPCGMAPPA